MGLTATAKVTTRAEYYGQRSLLQPENREWVTSIESTGASGFSLPPTVIFKGKVFIASWADELPDDWYSILKLARMDGPQMKSDFVGFKRTLFPQLFQG